MRATKINGIEDIYPLSPVQEGILFHTLELPGSGVYVNQFCLELEGELDEEALRLAWDHVVRRHAVLRTSIVYDRVAEPVQVVKRTAKLYWDRQDWRGQSEARQIERMRSYLKADRLRGFEMHRAPLMRLALIQTAADHFQLVWSHHHLMLDGWSIPIVLSEVIRLYEHHCGVNHVELLPRRPYSDYIAWLQRQDLTHAEAFWRGMLKGFCAATPLQVDGFRKANGLTAKQFDQRSTRLTRELSETLDHFARSHRLTLNTLIQGAWGLLLSRYSGQSDVVFGATSAGRPTDLPGAESMVGLFINTLPVRLQLHRSDKVLDLLLQLQQQQIDVRRYEYTPLTQIQSWSEVSGGQPLFRNILVFENYPVDEGVRSSAGKLRVRHSRSEESTHYPLTAVAAPGSQLVLQLWFDLEFFEGKTVERMMRHWERLLEQMAAEPGRRISELEMMGEQEQRQLLEEWNDTERELSGLKCIHEMFEEQVERTPGSVAVVYEDQRLTYEELNSRANQVAHYLRGLGVGPEVRVGICVERSVEMVVGLLGILKAGGAYVPLDPEYPAERLAYMVEDAQVPVLLTQSHLRERLPEGEARVVELDGEWPQIAEQSQEKVVCEVDLKNAAYVIYTSGSTGRPKGVVVAHLNVAGLFSATQPWFDFGETDVWTLFHSYAFDFSVWELWGALFFGGKLLVVSRLESRSPEMFYRLLHTERVTVLNQTPTGFRQLMEVDQNRQLPLSVRVVIFGGETLNPATVAPWFEQHRGATPVNMYGITETTVHATYKQLTEEDLKDGDRSSIGVRLANLQIYVLSEDLRPVPVGVTGELYIGGAGLARGYLNRPDLTAERFVPDPYGKKAGARLYRTGDLGKWREDGNIEFLGRVDDQVKIRGYRIELGEIEAVLREHAGVGEAVVVAREEEGREKRLVGYVVARQGEEAPGAGDLRKHLAGRLPEYMMPTAFVFLERMPLTPNGKLDRRALPAPDQGRPEQEQGYVGPRTPTEELLCGIWAKVLRLERVGVEDNFFEMGGHSLLATRVVSQIRQMFGIELPLRRLFEAPTVGELAEVVDEAKRAESINTLPPLLRVERQGTVPLSYAQERLWFIDQLEPNNALYNMPMAVRLKGLLNVEALERVLREVVRRHEVLRTRIEIQDGRGLQVIEGEWGGKLEVVDLSGLEEAEREGEVRRRAVAEASKPFDLSQGRLLRAELLQLGEQEHVLLATMHHIVSDGWSMGVLVKEVGTLYEAYVQGEPSPLGELEIQYADYAVWQRGWLKGEVLEEQLGYWKGQLAGIPVLELPTDRMRPAVASHRGASVPVHIPGRLLERLKELSQQEGLTLFMVLLAGFQILLSRYSGQDDVAVGTDVANRTRVESEELIGFFVNQLVLRTDLSGDPSVREMLGRVREVCLGAYAHQDLPFERLVQEINPEREIGRTPLFQAKLVLQNAPFEGVRIGELELELIPQEKTSARFDFLLNLQEQSGSVTAIECLYAADLFEGKTVERMMRHWERLLEQMAAEPGRRISELEMMGEQEQRQLLEEWNDTERELSGLKCIHEMFEEQVERTPGSVAVVYEDQRLTYEELNSRANHVAHYLRGLGVGPEVRVGICVERSVEMVVGLLGILKAGGAYVPLDPEYPAERLAYMVEDAQVPVLLTQNHLLGKLPTSWAQLVCLDSEWSQIAEQSQEKVACEVDPKNAAYVIYTSGSTGRPKGVLVTHGGLLNLALAQNDAFQINQDSRILQFASMSFDAAVWEWTSALVRGGALFLGIPAALMLAQDLVEVLERESISIVTLPPSVLKTLPTVELPSIQTHNCSWRSVFIRSCLPLECRTPNAKRLWSD